MAQLTLGNSRKGSNKEKEFFNGLTEKCMTANGRTERKMEAACGKVRKDSHISVNGKMAKLRALESLWSQVEIDTKESS